MNTFLTTHWVKPDPDMVAHQIFSLANELEEMIEPMAYAGSIVAMDIRENFATESDPSGEAWIPWAPSYEPYALAHGSGKILNLTGALSGAATSPSAFVATNTGLFFDTGGLPEYWAWNHFGATRKSGGERSEVATKEGLANRARNIILEGRRSGIVINAKAALQQAARQYKEDLAKGRFGINELPPRPFVGVSSEAAAKIDATFAAWFNGEVAMAMTPTGRTMARHARRWPKGTPGGLGGKFMPRDA